MKHDIDNKKKAQKHEIQKITGHKYVDTYTKDSRTPPLLLSLLLSPIPQCLLPPESMSDMPVTAPTIATVIPIARKSDSAGE